MLKRKLTHLEAHALAHRLQQAGEVVAGVVEELMGMEASAATPSPDCEQVGEAIYQVMYTDDDHVKNGDTGPRNIWMDASKKVFDEFSNRPNMRTRIVYASPSREQMGERWCFKCGHNAHEGSCADTSPSRERVEQECPHSVEDGACKQCYGEATRGEQGAAKPDYLGGCMGPTDDGLGGCMG